MADQEKTLIIQKLTQENHQLLEDVRQANAHVERMRSELLKRNTPVEEKERSHRGNQTRPNIEFKHSQTTTVEVVGASSLENMISDKETERKLVVHLEHEVQCILYEMKGKDRQLHDQNDLITLLVQKMFSVYKVLRTLYEESFVMIEDLDSHCYCGVDGLTLVVQEKYKEVIEVLQEGIRKSISGIEDENAM
ncbi:hypothetical protein QE152_g1044 [Popillia japonica]|uniref:Uncharacterized protein n=1 Tax=Popillia japonica TaxID=7064 RepID=A0AAW1NC68_POPJA